MSEEVVNGIVITDRRGEKKQARVEIPVEVAPAEKKDRSFFKSVGFVIVLNNGPQGIVPLVRAIGERSDGEVFLADWVLAPVLNEKTDIIATAQMRLNTYLNCDCGNRQLCPKHKHITQQWMQQDTDRLNRVASEPLPRAIEIWSMAESARKNSAIIAPGRVQ